MEEVGETAVQGKRSNANRVLIFGPSGSGTSTLGRALAGALSSQHFDADDFYWHPTDPPFREKRPVPERHRLMHDLFLSRRDWVLSGSVSSWAGPIPERLTLAVRLELTQDLRRARLESRERQRLGFPDAGSPSDKEIRSFLAWADGYELGLRPGRSLAQHKDWAAQLSCPVLVLDSAPPVERLCQTLCAALTA